MLHILLLILKIIGIIILVLLGLLLLAVCCILFVPVRYRAHAHYDETAGAQAKISWLLRLIYLKAELAPETEGFHLVLKILGITFFDNQKPKKKKPEKKKPERKTTERQKPEKAAGEPDKPASPASEQLAEPKQSAVEADKSALPEANKPAVEADKPALPEAEQPADEADKSAMPEAELPAAEADRSALPEAEQPASEANKPALPKTEQPAAKADHPADPQEKMPPDRIEMQSDEHTIDESEPEPERAPGIGDKLRHFLHKIKEKLLGILSRIKGVAASVKNFFSHMADTRNSLLTKLGNVAAKKNAVWAILIDEKNRPAFLKVKKLVFRILHHLQPTKLDIRLEFGFADPASTGYTLGLLSLLYPVYTDHIRLYPDFENKVFKGECTARGRLRASVFLFVVCQLIFDKDVRRILKSFKNI